MKSKFYFLYLLLSVIGFPLFGQNETEPNNSFTDANSLPLGNNLKASINPANDKDMF